MMTALYSVMFMST